MVRTLRYGSDNRIDGSRILGYAAAIALHALALMLLLIPMTAPQGRPAAATPKPQFRWIEREQEKPKEPVPVPVTQHRRTEKPKLIENTRPMVAPVIDQPAIVDTGSRVVDIPASADAGTDTIVGPVATGPISVASLGYGVAPPPPYPRAELQAGIQGTVLLKVLVDVDGTPLEVVVQTSSGSRNLDRSAVQHVLKRWRFQPAMQDGRAVQAYGLVPIVFSLQ